MDKIKNMRKLGWIALTSVLLSGATVLTAEDGKAKSEGDAPTGRATIDVRKTVNPAVSHDSSAVVLNLAHPAQLWHTNGY